MQRFKLTFLRRMKKPVCAMFASIYRRAVTLAGASFFNGAGVAEPAGIEQLNVFIAYLDKHPDAFDPKELEMAFVSLQKWDKDVTEYEYWLFTPDSQPPLLVVRKGNDDVLKIRGVKAGK